MLIGIDPDLDKSWVFEVDSTRLCTLRRLYLWHIFNALEYLQGENLRPYVVIEAGWKNKRGLSFSQGRMRAVRTGMNHAIGMQIEAFCKQNEIEYELFIPTSRTPKWDHETMIRLTGIDVKKSNQEIRDAVRAVYFSSKGREVFR